MDDQADEDLRESQDQKAQREKTALWKISTVWTNVCCSSKAKWLRFGT